MTFSGESFFSSKVPELLHVLLNLGVKHSPVLFFGPLCTLFLKKTRTKYCGVHNECNKAKQEKTIFFKFSAPLLIRVDVGQVIKARVYLGYFFLEYRFKS